MRILLYNPDNGVTRNFMPHLWMFLLRSLTPSGHEVLLIDGNAQPMNEAAIARFVREQNIGFVGIGAMTRMIAKAYRVADAVRVTGGVMRTPWSSVRRTKPGRESSRMLRGGNSETSTLRSMNLARNANRDSTHIPRFRGIR